MVQNHTEIQGTTAWIGAPKYKAMQLIDTYENTPRGFYGGSLGCIGFDGQINKAIMIRFFLSKNNKLTIQMLPQQTGTHK